MYVHVCVRIVRFYSGTWMKNSFRGWRLTTESIKTKSAEKLVHKKKARSVASGPAAVADITPRLPELFKINKKGCTNFDVCVSFLHQTCQCGISDIIIQ